MFETSLIQMIGLNDLWTQVLVLGLMCVILAGIHYVTPKFKVTRSLGPQVPTFFIALALSNLRIFPAPDYALYNNIYNVGLPVALALLLLSIDIRAMVKSLKPRVFVVMVCACFATFFGALVAGIVFRPDVLGVKTLASCAGAAIGGTENMLATAAALEIDHDLIGAITAINMLVYTVSCMILFGVAGSDAMLGRLNSWIKPLQDPKALAAEVHSHAKNKEYFPINTKTTLMMVASVMGCIAVSQFVAKFIKPIPLPGGGEITISWYLILTTVCLVVGTFTPVGKFELIEHAAMPLLFLSVMAIFLKADLLASLEMINLFPVVLTMYMLHKVFVIISAKILRVDALTSVTASMAAIGGGASAPMIPTVAGVPEMIPLSIIFATIGYAFANYLAWADGQILLKLLHGITV